MALATGTRLGDYEILALIGSGGMGDVYRAFDANLQRTVAVKLLADSGADPIARGRFQREAQLCSALNHPHILTVLDAGEHEGRQYLVTEFVDGGTLREWVSAAPRGWQQSLDLLIGVADGLAMAHEAGILHRDVKPENILITKRGYAKIADFGLAKLYEPAPRGDGAETVARTRAGTIVGTAPYMSPEQALGQPLDSRSDVFSFGIVLYESVAGRRPFSGATESQLLKNVVNGAAAPLPDTVPPALRAIVHKALEPDPANRYQAMRDLVVDLRGLVRPLDDQAAATRRPARTWAWAAAALAALAIIGGLSLWTRSPERLVAADRWTPLTHFSDSVGQPALSRDGRMLAFVRGAGSFTTLGQVYVKLLPDGDPRPLTADDYQKMSPVFSPDGSRIVYTAHDQHNNWDTWDVSVLGGTPRRWLPNASGLAWTGQRIVFSEIFDRLEGNHMKIVAADESRGRQRDVYIPQPRGAMAHRSFPSPDGSRLLLAEMNDRGDWLPCRVVPLDGSSTGRPVGPANAPCWFAAWSPDGKSIYVSAAATEGSFHIWRQPYTESALPPAEQITAGPTSEEGIAMAPDGKSLVTAVGLTQRSVWIHDGRGDRQISLEGFAFSPLFSADGRTLFYLKKKDRATELWIADVQSGRTEPLLPGVAIGISVRSGSYDVSPDGRQVVFSAAADDGTRQIWVAATDRRTPPRAIAAADGDGPLFRSADEIVFRRREGTYGFAYGIRLDGTGLRKLVDHPAIQTMAVSPDGEWVVEYARPSEGQTGATLAFPLAGGAPLELVGNRASWSRDGKQLVLSTGVDGYSGVAGRTYAIPVHQGRTWPVMPSGGFQTEEEIARIPGVRIIDSQDVAPGPTPDVYAFSREAVQRNLYRIPIP